MKFRRALAPLLLVAFCSPSLAQAQEARQRQDPGLRAAADALRAGRLTDAERILTDAIHDLEQSEPQSLRLADDLHQLAFVERMLEHKIEADALDQRASTILRAVLPPSDMRLAQDLLMQSYTANSVGDSSGRERLINQALEIVKLNSDKLDTPVNLGTAEGVVGEAVMINLAAHHWLEADALFPELSRLCGRIEEAYRSGYPPCNRLPEVLAEIHHAEGKPADTSQLPYGGNDPAELQTLNDAAKKFVADGLYPSAEDALTTAIAAAQKLEADPRNVRSGLTVMEMNLLGQLYEKEGFLDRAERTFVDSLKIQEGKVNPEPGRGGYAATIGALDLVDLYRKENRLKDAESVLQNIVEIQTRALGERHRVTIQTMVRLAGLETEEGKADAAEFTKARSLYERALALQETNLGPENRQLINVLAPYGDLLKKMNDTAKAAEVQERIKQLSAAR